MAEILEYFDNIRIDVAKRKYYNVNKVNAVLEELRRLAVDLVEENELQRKELYQLRSELDKLKANGQQSEEMLTALQEIYRDTLSKAHERADTIIRDADERSEKLTREAEQKAELAVKQMESCIEAIRVREEQNISFLESQLRQFLTALDQKETEKATPEEESGIEHDEALDSTETDNMRDTSLPQEKTAGIPDSRHLQELELKIRKLAEEVSALEAGI